MQNTSTTGPFFLCFSLVLWKELNIHPALPSLPARLLLVAQTLCFTHILSPLHQGTGKFRLTLGNTHLDEDDNAGTWQSINSPWGAWGQGLFTGTIDIPRKGVSDPLPIHACVKLVCSDGTVCSRWLLSGNPSGHACFHR